MFGLRTSPAFAAGAAAAVLRRNFAAAAASSPAFRARAAGCLARPAPRLLPLSRARRHYLGTSDGVPGVAPSRVWIPIERRVFVGNVAYEATPEDLTEYFQQFGPVARVSMRPSNPDGKGPGFAFVAFENEASAKKATQNADGTVFMGRQIQVMPHMTEEEKQTAGAVPRPEVASRKERSLCFHEIPADASTEQLVQHFSRFGPVVQVYLPWSVSAGKAPPHGYVEFESAEDAGRALRDPDATKFNGHPITLRWNADKFFYKLAKSAGQVYIRNLPYDTTEDEVREHCSRFGKIVDVRLPQDRGNNGARGFAFVAFESMESVHRAIEATHGMSMRGRTLSAEVGKRTRGPAFRLPDSEGAASS